MKGEWVRVDERLPAGDEIKGDEEYLLYYEFRHCLQGEIKIGHLSEQTQILFDWHNPVSDKKLRRVTHWQCLPDKPEV